MTRSVAHQLLQVHLPSLIALCVSTMLHAAIIWGLSIQSKPLPAKLTQIKNQGLQVHLLSGHSSKTYTDTSQTAQSLYTDAMEALAKLPQMPTSIADNTPEQSQTSNDVALNQYYSSKQIDRKALPIANIDTSQLQGEVIDTFPLQFRIYIDDKGKVKSIEQLAVLEQDIALANKLERLLYELTFIPAKKNGVEVNSYQDIEFSFQATFNSNSGNEATPPVGAYSIGSGLSK